jgi:hypothetical protein
VKKARETKGCGPSNGTFIPHSQNKAGGTANHQEHRAIPFVVGWAMQTREETF